MTCLRWHFVPEKECERAVPGVGRRDRLVELLDGRQFYEHRACVNIIRKHCTRTRHSQLSSTLAPVSSNNSRRPSLAVELFGSRPHPLPSRMLRFHRLGRCCWPHLVWPSYDSPSSLASLSAYQLYVQLDAPRPVSQEVDDPCFRILLSIEVNYTPVVSRYCSVETRLPIPRIAVQWHSSI